MSKRNQIIKETKESKALKALRIKADLGIRKLAQKMNYSHTRVHQFETGREDLNDAYIQIFLEAIGVSQDEWQRETGGFKRSINLRDKCHELLDKVDSKKLEMLHSLLRSI